MGLPTPPVPLKNHCSIIYNNTLYTYQVDAFQSLALKDGATWEQLPMGVSTNGSTCVQGAFDHQDSFIVIGGSTSTANYRGLQSYSFSANKWHTDTPVAGVATNRLDHGTAYLQQSSAILMYAGSQNNVYGPSSQTFLFETTSPYFVQAFTSFAPPLISPLILRFNTTHALMLGGGPENTKLFTFGRQEGWQQLNVSLPKGLQDSSMVQATIMDGSDGSKVLEVFDFSVSPNQLWTVPLQNATSTSSFMKKSYKASAHHPARRRRRDSPSTDRPAYNNTLAPQETRRGFSLAQDPKTGLVVASGGSSQAPLAMFNQTSNQWVDPDQFFGIQPDPSSTSRTPSAPSTPPSAATSEAVDISELTAHNRSLTILGGVLGGVFGFAALVILLLLLLRYYRRRRAKGSKQNVNEYALDSKAEMDFQDVGADFMKEAGGNFASNHRSNKSDKSNASANVKGAERAGAASSHSKRALLHHKGNSAGSQHSFWSRKSAEKSPPTISAPFVGLPIAETLQDPATRTERREEREDTGWSRYFTHNNSNELTAMSGANEPEARPQTYVSNSQTESGYTSSHPHESAEVEPLNIHASQNPSVYPPNTRVVSPTGSRPPGPGVASNQSGALALYDEPSTPSTILSGIDDDDEYAHHSHSDGQESWTPVAAAGERGSVWTEDRPVSSVYDSKIYPHPGERVRIPNFPTVPNSQRASAVSTPPKSPVNGSGRGMRNVASKGFARTASGRVVPQTELDVPRVPQWGASQMRERANPEAVSGMPAYGDNQIRTFPRRNEDPGARSRDGKEAEDMSWLNLGMSAEQNTNHLRFAGS